MINKGSTLKGIHKLVKGLIVFPKPEFCKYTQDFLPVISAPKAIPTACPSFVAITCSKSDFNIEFWNGFNALSGNPVKKLYPLFISFLNRSSIS